VRVTPILCIVMYEVLRSAVVHVQEGQSCGVYVLAAKHTSMCLHGAPYTDLPNPRVAVLSQCCRYSKPTRQKGQY
jgi:hypothetical protein